MKTVQCYKCKNEVEKNMKICPVCGGPIVTHYSIGWFFLGIVILIIAIGYFLSTIPKDIQPINFSAQTGTDDLSVKALLRRIMLKTV